MIYTYPYIQHCYTHTIILMYSIWLFLGIWITVNDWSFGGGRTALFAGVTGATGTFKWFVVFTIIITAEWCWLFGCKIEWLDAFLPWRCWPFFHWVPTAARRFLFRNFALAWGWRYPCWRRSNCKLSWCFSSNSCLETIYKTFGFALKNIQTSSSRWLSGPCPRHISALKSKLCRLIRFVARDRKAQALVLQDGKRRDNLR